MLNMVDSKEIDIVLLISDLSGYTALTEAHGNVSAAKVVNRYTEIAEEALYEGTRLIERVGDEIIIAGTDATDIIKTALKLVHKIEEEPFFPTVHAGIHAGKVLEQERHYYGSALNVASRVASHAQGCQILCTKVVAEMVGEMQDIKFRAIGEINFKNIFEPVALFEIITDCRKLEMNVVDPVCRMLVRPQSAPAHLKFRGNNYYFCSFKCAKKFASQPNLFIKN
jgi:class 3 adenylate cyclase/YHS domain-containing protein